MARPGLKFEEQFEAFLKESMSEDDSAKSEKILPKAEDKLWWLNEDDESDNEIGKGRNFLKNSGPTHSTPNDSKKKPADNERTKENSNKVERLSNRYARSGDLSTNPKGMRRFEGTLSKDSLEDISEKSEEDSEGKRNKMQRKNSVAVTEITSQVTTTAAAAVNSNKKPQDEMVHTISPSLLNQESSHPGQDTLEELMDKQKFFSELEQNASGTLDYGLLNQQLSKTASVDLYATMGQNENSPIINDAYAKEEQSETPPTLQKPSLLSKVSLMDSMGSSLNTTGTSIQADTGNSPVVSKEHLKDALKDTGSVLTQKEFTGTVTSQEMEDLHIALQNIDMSSTFPPADVIPSANQFQGDIQRPLEPGQEEMQLAAEDQAQVQVEDHLEESEQTNEAYQVNDSDISKLTINDLFKNTETEPSAAIHNNQDPCLSLSSSLEQPTPVVVHGFDLVPAVMTQSPDHDLSTSVDASGDLVQTKPKFQEVDPVHPIQPKKSTSNAELQKPNKYSKLPSSGYGQRSLATTKTKSKREISSASRPATFHKSGPATQKTVSNKSKPLTNNCSLIADLLSNKAKQNSEISQDVSQQMQGDIYKTSKINADDDDLQKEVEYWKNKWEEEKEQLLQLKGNIAEMETNHKHNFNQQKQMYEIEIDKLKKSNFILNSKMSKVHENNSDPARLSSEELAELQKELSEQQVLLSGYQTENERLYNEMKQLKAQYKVTEDKMFRENQKLLMELSSLKNQFEFKENLYPSVSSPQSAITHNAMETVCKSSSGPTSTESGYCTNCGGQPATFAVSKISQLESQRQQVQDEYKLARSQNCILEKTKRELEFQINLLIQQKEEMRQSLQEVKSGKLEEFHVIESQLKEEKDEMKKKLHWYAYNQQLLDQDVAVFKQKDKEIEKLNKKIEQLQSETGRRFEENKQRLKERATFQSRIQDLERQVREMERIFQKRNPNSLTTLFLAAGNLEKDVTKESPSLVVKVLEEKVKKLESELEMKENMEEKRIRSVEQKYNKLKFQYEEQIDNLEQQVRHLQQKCSLGDHPHSHRLALEKELESVRERHRNETAELQVYLDQLRGAVDKLKKDDGCIRAEMKATQERESELQAQNQLLRKQLDNSNQQVTMMRTSVTRLQREKKQQQQQLIRHQQANARQNSINLDFNKRQKSKKNESSSVHKKFPQENKNFTETVELPEEILEENEALKTELDHLQLIIEQQKVELHKIKAESESILWKIREKHQVQIDNLRLSHQQQLQQMLTEQTLQYSTSQIPELKSKIDAQQILINHLKEQLASAQVDSEKLSALNIREVVLANQVQQLEDDLKEAKKSYSPDRRHFESLVNKIQDLENKHSTREKELQNVIKNGLKLQAPQLEKEVNKWKRIAESKNQDIENYRVELDSILNILHSLQKQEMIISGNGLKIPTHQNMKTFNHSNVV